MKWAFDRKTKRYRNLTTGRFIKRAEAVGLRDTFIQAQLSVSDGLAAALVSRQLTTAEWLLASRKLIKDTFIAEYLAGRGGKSLMTPADWGRLGYMLRTQYEYLQEFANAINRGELSEKAIMARARMYIRAATQAFERGVLAAYGLPDLHPVPGDGTTECKTSCRCHLAISETPEEWHVRWVLDPACQHCGDCPEYAALWNPLIIPKMSLPNP